MYNRTPHHSIDMKIPLCELVPNCSFEVNQLKRFGCVSIFKIPRNNNSKFGEQALRGFLVGYKPTGFLIYVAEEKKLYESRHVKFLENKVYRRIKEKGTELADKRKPGRPSKVNESKEKVVLYMMYETEEESCANTSSESELRDRDITYHALLAKI